MSFKRKLLGVLSMAAFAAVLPSAAAPSGPANVEAAAEVRAAGERSLWYRIASVRYEWNHRTEFTSPASGQSGLASTKVAWKARSPRGESPLIRRRASGRLGFSGAYIEGNLTEVTHTYTDTWRPPQDPTPCTPETIHRRETLIGAPRIDGGVILGLGFRWEGLGTQATSQYVDTTGPVVCDECPLDHPIRGKRSEPGPGNSCTFSPDDPQVFDDARIAEQYHSDELETQMVIGDETQTRLSGGFGDGKIRFRNRVEGEAPKFVGPDGTERTEGADKTVTFELKICGRAGLRPC